MAAPVPQMITANRLIDGEVLYWREGRWVSAFADGEVFADAKAAEAALEIAKAFVRDNVVVGLYAFDVRRTARGIEPVKEREIIRAAGPSNRTDTGKQAGLGPQEPKDVAPIHL
jgi:sulfite reductase (NADPH) hemoprotein beta-component